MPLAFNKSLIFTDLDGTLLDHETYSYKTALPALNLLKEKGVPVIFMTSKTKPEVLELKAQMGNVHPFGVENGGAIILPQNSFNQQEEVIPLGASYSDIRTFLENTRKEGFLFEGFGDMSAKRIAEITGLDEPSAEKAGQRAASEPLLWLDSEDKKKEFIQKVESAGLQALQGGRFLSIGGKTDKGKAALRLIEIYKQNGFDVENIIALGDSGNDKALLSIATHPIWIRKEGATPDSSFLENARCSLNYGPQGWADTILQLFNP